MLILLLRARQGCALRGARRVWWWNRDPHNGGWAEGPFGAVKCEERREPCRAAGALAESPNAAHGERQEEVTGCDMLWTHRRRAVSQLGVARSHTK
eukprot:3301283-Prymnesium_polylepis.1